MSLRARLTIFYTAVLGVVLVLFGLAMFGLISTVLLRQVDNTLDRAARDLLFVTRVDEAGHFVFSQRVSLDSSVISQIWDEAGVLVATSQAVEPDSPLRNPLDPDNLNSDQPIYRDVMISNLRFRVLTVPLQASGEPIGVLQTATSLTVINAVRGELIQFLLILSAIAILVAGFIGWASAWRALAPLSTVTNTALQITRADDLSRRIPLTSSPDDEVGRLISAFNDTISRLEELFSAQRRFVADVGHELRTPLTVIRGNIDLMRREGAADVEFLHSVELEVDRLTRLVEDLLILAQAESGKLPMELRRVELDTLVLEVFSQARVLSGEDMEMRIGEIDQVMVCGDRDRLKQVTLNLISNAIKYTLKGGKIRVDLRKNDSWAEIAVHNTGEGIPSKELPHIFERFYRGDKARHRDNEGTGFGLGLSIAYWIVRNHGGNIEAQSDKKSGTLFTVRLPLATGECLPPIREVAPNAVQPERTN
ncbi:MAG: HAMP domain-containing protein [Chloroflexi bacterium]|nr:ATP-binding protein [Chloroflexota bacterium]MQC25919.1 HAMP domain-containing protein [Chloroflexota bacterium]